MILSCVGEDLLRTKNSYLWTLFVSGGCLVTDVERKTVR